MGGWVEVDWLVGLFGFGLVWGIFMNKRKLSEVEFDA